MRLRRERGSGLMEAACPTLDGAGITLMVVHMRTVSFSTITTGETIDVAQVNTLCVK